MDSPQAGGPGGGAPASPIGGEPTTPQPSTPAEPSVIELTDDSMVRLPGQKDPVKYGDYYRGFQSQFTKKAQEASQASQRYKQLEKQAQEYQRRLQQFESQQRAAQKPNPGNDLKETIRSLPYLSGEDAARVVDHLNQQFGGFEQAIQQRDAALVLLTKQLMSMKGIVDQLHSRSSGADFDGKIKRFVSDQGLPPEAEDLAKEIYLAYEGDDLDTEFPKILQNRWRQIETAIQAAQKRKVEEARNRAFLPGKGGQGSPSAPLQNMAQKSAREIADDLWPGMVDGGTET